MTQVRVMTYNILRGGQKEIALNEVVRAASPEVLLVNETPKFPILWKRRCRHLAEKWRLRFVGGGRPAGANMVLTTSRVSVKAVRTQVIKQPLFQPRRGIVAAQLRLEGKLFGVVSCHLSLNRDRRAGEVERVVVAADQLRGPVVVAGDLNEPPGGPSWRRLRQVGFTDHGSDAWLTLPAERPEKRIDALLVRGAVSVLHHGGPEVPPELLAAASDHLPVFAVLDF